MVALGAPTAAARDSARDGWVLVTDEQGRPQGWLDVRTTHTTTVTADLLNLSGTLATPSATLRETLDAALSSPSGRGVVVDGDSRLLGTVTTSEVVARIEEQTRSRAAVDRQGCADQAMTAP